MGGEAYDDRKVASVKQLNNESKTDRDAVCTVALSIVERNDDCLLYLNVRSRILGC
jgi:hypothetical protein